MQIYLPAVKQKKGEALEYCFQGKIRDYLESEADDQDSFTLHVTVRSSGDKILVAGEFQAEIGVNCSRCLQPFRRQMESGFSEAFTIMPLPDKKSTPEELALKTANELTVSGDYLYLNEYIRQLFVLGQVYKPLCSPDCRGLCAGCGADLNKGPCSCADEAQIDLRLLKLKDFHPGTQD